MRTKHPCVLIHIRNNKKCVFFLGSNQYWARRVYGLCVYYMSGAPEISTDSGSGEAGDRTCDPWFTRHEVYPITTAASTSEIRVKSVRAVEQV